MPISDARYLSLLTRDTLALIPACERDTRFHELAARRAKPAPHFEGKFCNIDFPLSNCTKSGIRRISVFAQDKAHALTRHPARVWGCIQGNLGESF